jgi:hypothetical protein
VSRILALIACLGLPAAASAAALTPTASAMPAAASPSAAAWSDHGFEYRVSLTQLSVFNAAPLAYSPLEVGWRWPSGLRVRSGIDVFFYNGQEADANGAQQLYSYSMQDWRTTLAYEAALPLAIHPYVGLSLDFLWGSRQLSQVPLNTANNPTSAWGGIGPGGLLGLVYRSSAHWAWSVEGRYSVLFGPPAVAAADLGLSYLF